MYGYEFPLTGGAVFPVDHGYLVLSALSTQRPFIHGRREVQIAPILGCARTPDHDLKLGTFSRLHVRGITPDEAVDLASVRISLAGSSAWVGLPQVKPLALSPRLASRLVLFKAALSTKEEYTEHLFNKLAELGDLTGVEVTVGRDPRGLQVKGIIHRGYSVELQRLPPALSETLLKQGLGIKTSMGAGVFGTWRGMLE